MFKPRTSNTSNHASSTTNSFLGVQAKLNIGKSDDKYEREADRMADKVVNKTGLLGSEAFIPPKSNIQKKGNEEQEVQKQAVDEQIQEKSLLHEITPLVQRKEEEIQEKADEEVQEKQEEEIQEKTKEEPIQTKVTEEEPIQQKEESDIQPKLDSDRTTDQKIQRKIDVIQQKADEEVQEKQEEEIQEKTEEEPIQTKATEEEPIQQKEESDIQPKLDSDRAVDQKIQRKIDVIQQKADEEVQEKQEEEIQEKTEEEPIQQKEESDIQAKLDSDRTVDQKIQRKIDVIQQKADEEVQQKEENEVQKKSDETGSNTSALEQNLARSKGGGSSMDPTTKNQMESGFGTDFSGVKIHNDSNAVQMNKELGAQAFTNGNDIYFNEGKYNPTTKSGQHLLAHELTHTVQQGASTQPAVQKAQGAPVPAAAPILKPTTPLDITHRLNITNEWAIYLDAEYEKKKKPIDVDVKIGERFYGTIGISRKKGTDAGELAKYEINKQTKNNFLKIKGWNFLQPLREAGIEPVLVLNNFGDEQITTGYLSVSIQGAKPLGQAKGFLDGLNSKLDKMGFLGVSRITIADGYVNEFSAGRLVFQVGAMKTVVDGYLEAGGGLGITGDVFTFNVNANINVAGLASGEFMIARAEDGSFSGSADIEADIANVNAKLHVEYINGAVTIQGTGRIQSEKFSGEITFLVTDAERSRQLMHAALGVETMDAENEQAAAPAAPTPKSKGNQVLAGWGEITANITPWLSGTAKVGIDAEGHVTIVGEITVPQEVELMEQRGKKVDIFKVEIRAGYGIPLVGQVFLFASIGMFMNAGFGPLVLKNVGFKGTYSTDPSVLQEFEITGTLSINAFAILGLEAEAGVGVTILGHDVKAGVNVTAAAGLRAYAEATPTLAYKEQAAPEGGKMGETRLKGHFEAAAQLFMQLSGALFFEIDSPWWSPAPDGREEFPFGEVQYPIGDSMGIGADMDWLVGSPEIPELKFSPVEFDANKFTSDIMADPPPRKLGKSDEEKPGEWVDGNKPAGHQETPETKDGKGLPDTGKEKEDLKKLPDEQKYMRALDEMAKLEKAEPKPTFAVVKAKAEKVKAKYGLDQIKATDSGDIGEVFVKHAKQDNSKHILEIPMMSAAERYKLLKAAMDDLKLRNAKAGGKEGTVTEEEAKQLITDWQKTHPVVEEARVVDGGATWDYFIDIGDKSETEKGKAKKSAENENVPLEKGDGEVGKLTKFTAGKDNHRSWIRVSGMTVEVIVASIEMSVSEKLANWTKALPALEEGQRGNASTLINSTKGLYDLTYKAAVLANQLKVKLETNPADAPLSKQANDADNDLEIHQDKLKFALTELFEIFGEGKSEFDIALVQAFVNFNSGEKRRLYLEKVGEDLILKLENENPGNYRAFIEGIDLTGHKNPEEAAKAISASKPLLNEIEKLIASRAADGSTEADRDAFNEQKAKKIDVEVEKLVPITKVLFERVSDLPETTEPKYSAMSGPPDLLSSGMTVEILTTKGPHGSVPTTAKHTVYDLLNKRRNGGTSYYVKGHMLNHNVHGPGEYKNLTPLSVEGNKAHLLNVENTVKIAVSAGTVIKYIVKIGPLYNVSIPTPPELTAMGIDPAKHNDLIEVRRMENYVPKNLVVSAYTLREDGNSGKFTIEKDIVKDKPIHNYVDTNIENYQIGTGTKKEKLVLTTDSATDIAKLIGDNAEDVKLIQDIVVKNKFRQFRSLINEVNTNPEYAVDKEIFIEVINKMISSFDNGKGQLKLYEN